MILARALVLNLGYHSPSSDVTAAGPAVVASWGQYQSTPLRNTKLTFLGLNVRSIHSGINQLPRLFKSFRNTQVISHRPC